MRTGRAIKLRNPQLKKIRSNLRSLLLAAVKEKFHKDIDLGELQLSVDNVFGVRRINQEVDRLYKLLFDSICICKSCRSIERDAVFVHHDVIDQFIYPPLKETEKHSPSFWNCPSCYEKLMKKVQFYKKEEYYFFREYGIFDTLDGIGIDNLDDLDKFQED